MIACIARFEGLFEERLTRMTPFHDSLRSLLVALMLSGGSGPT